MFNLKTNFLEFKNKVLGRRPRQLPDSILRLKVTFLSKKKHRDIFVKKDIHRTKFEIFAKKGKKTIDEKNVKKGIA